MEMEPVSDNEESLRLNLPRWEDNDEALVYYLVTARYGGPELPSSVRDELDRIEATAKEDPEFASRVQDLLRRIDNLDSGGEASSQDADSPVVSEPAPRRSNRDKRHRYGTPPVRRARSRSKWLVGGVSAFAFTLVAASLLLAAQSNTRGLASLQIDIVQADDLVLRGGSRPIDPEIVQRLEQARRHLEDAERAILGHVLWYDRIEARRAASLLEAVLADAQPGDPSYAEAAYTLARASLMMGDERSTDDALGKAASGTGPFATAAVAALERREMNRRP